MYPGFLLLGRTKDYYNNEIMFLIVLSALQNNTQTVAN